MKLGLCFVFFILAVSGLLAVGCDRSHDTRPLELAYDDR